MSRWNGYTVGIDPGKKGGLVIIKRYAGMIWACTWKIEKECIRFKEGNDTKFTKVQDMDFLYETVKLACGKDYLLGVEGLRYIKGRPGIIDCAENAGWWLGLLGRHAFQVYRPSSTIWRRDVLGMSERYGNKFLKPACIKAMNQHFVMPDVGKYEGVCDAAAIALWTQQQHTLALRGIS